MRSDALNFHIYTVRTEMTALYLHVCSTDKSELKKFLVNETLSQSCSTDEEEPKGIIVHEYSTDDEKYESKSIIINECSTEEDK